jgi:hypothetical protein
MKRPVLSLIALLACGPALGQATYNSAVGVWGVDSATSQPCLIASKPVSPTCGLPGLGSSSGSSGAVTIADGAAITIGTTTDAVWGAGAGSVVSILKAIATGVSGSIPPGTSQIGHVVTDTGSTTAVTGNVAITAAALPLPGGAATASGVAAIATALGASPMQGTGATDLAATANLTVVNQAATLATVNAMTTGVLELSGAFVGGVVVEASMDGWTTVKALKTMQPGTVASTAPMTAPGYYRVIGVAGYPQVRVRASAYTSGTIVATLRLSAAADAMTVLSLDPLNFLTTASSSITNAQVAPATTAAAYAAGTVLGGIMSFTAQPNTGLVEMATLVLNSGSFAGTIDLFLFNAAPTGGGCVDNAAFALTSTDYSKLMGVVQLTTVASLGGAKALVQGSSLGASFGPLAAAGTTIFAVAVVRGSAVTLTGVADATFGLEVVK